MITETALYIFSSDNITTEVERSNRIDGSRGDSIKIRVSNLAVDHVNGNIVTNTIINMDINKARQLLEELQKALGDDVNETTGTTI